MGCVVVGGGEGVCAGAQARQVDADEGQAVCDVFIVEGAIADPAFCAGEVVDGLGALDAGRYLTLLVFTISSYPIRFRLPSSSAQLEISNGSFRC